MLTAEQFEAEDILATNAVSDNQEDENFEVSETEETETPEETEEGAEEDSEGEIVEPEGADEAEDEA